MKPVIFDKALDMIYNASRQKKLEYNLTQTEKPRVAALGFSLG